MGNRPKMTSAPLMGLVLRVVSVQLLEKCTVLGLTDGSIRVVDLRPLLKGTVCRSLLDDVAPFKKVGVEHGTLSWPAGHALRTDVLVDAEISRRVATVGDARWLPFASLIA